ncbi:MAG: restriction endonuclease subunit S [Muribaculaceae bacterium]|nr:restriction endonuclease subunit S [Muribaculaceae bacterium]
MNHGWQKKKLGEVCDIYQPKTVSTKDLVEDGEYDVFGANGIIGKYTNYNHEDPEVLLTCRGATCGTINISNPKSWINGNAMVIHPKSNGLSKSYLRIILQSVDYTNVITGVAQPQITRTSISPVEIQIPSIEQQCQIVSELDKLNELIELKRNQFKDLDTLAQSLFYETFGDPIENPKGWEIESISNIAPQQQYDGEIVNNNGLYWLLNLDMIEKNTGRIINYVYVKADEIGNSVYKIGPNQVLFSKLRPNLNKVVIVNHTGFCTSELLPLNPKNGALNSVFLSYLLRLPECVSIFSGKVAGAKMPRVDLKVFRNFPLIVPPLSLQNEFAAKIAAIEEQKRLIESTIADLEILLACRMDYWFND